jgi:hypothetical protein
MAATKGRDCIPAFLSGQYSPRVLYTHIAARIFVLFLCALLDPLVTLLLHVLVQAGNVCLVAVGGAGFAAILQR